MKLKTFRKVLQTVSAIGLVIAIFLLIRIFLHSFDFLHHTLDRVLSIFIMQITFWASGANLGIRIAQENYFGKKL